MIVKVISGADTASLLYQYLGPLCDWTHFLDSCRIRDDYNLCGLRLLPTCQTLSKSWRPRYAVSDVVEFIESVREVIGSTKPAIKLIPVEIPSSDSRPWNVRKLRSLATTSA